MDGDNTSDPPPKKKRSRGRYFNYYEPTSAESNIPRTTIMSHSSQGAGSSSGSRVPDNPTRQLPVAIDEAAVQAGINNDGSDGVDEIVNRDGVEVAAVQDGSANFSSSSNTEQVNADPPAELAGNNITASSNSECMTASSDSDSTASSDSESTASSGSESDDNSQYLGPTYDRSLTSVETGYDDPRITNIPCVGACICSRCDCNKEETDQELPAAEGVHHSGSSSPVVSRKQQYEGVDFGSGDGDGGEDGGGDGGGDGVGDGVGGGRRDRWNRKYGWNDPLLPNLETTKFEAMLMILHIVMRHGMTGPFIEDMLKFVNALLGEEVIPTSEFIFKKLFAPHISLQFHFYCIKCNQYLGEKKSFTGDVVTCGSCATDNKVHNLSNNNFFVTFSIKEQLEEMFKRPGFNVAPRVDHGGVITDILDGDVYKGLFLGDEPVANEHTLTITFNTDGAPVWTSGPRGSIWSVIYVLNELDSSVRFKPENVILCGLYFGKESESPNMSLFFTPFVQEMQDLAINGVKKTTENGEEVLCPVFATICCTDLMAKCKLQCTKQCNGRKGCGYCLHPNDTVCEDLPSNQGRYSTMSPDYPYPLRTHEQMVKDMIQADVLDQAGLLQDDSVNGVTGISPLVGPPKVDIVNVFAIDYMHNAKGVSEKMCEVLFDSKKYVDTINVAEVSNRLAKMKPPHTMTRFPRSLNHRGSEWKAKHYIGFLLYCLLPCVHDMLPERNFKNICDLVGGLHILLREKILLEDLERADMLLQRFLREFNVLYGDRHMTHNMHLLSHLCQAVKNCGPLPGVSAFPFESLNKFLLSLVAGTSGVVTQICQKYATLSFVSHYFKEYHVSDRVLDFCNSIFSYYDFLKNSESYADGRGLGKATDGQFSIQEREAMNEANVDLQNDSYSSYNRVVKEKVVYYARIYKKPEVYDDTCVKLQDDTYAVIEKLVVIPGYDNIWALVKPIRISQSENDRWVSHIKSCAADMYDGLRCVKLGEILFKCILIKNMAACGRSFICEIPNKYERD